MQHKELDLGHLAEEFSKLLTTNAGQKPVDQKVELEEGERREVTILFLDIVGYTKLAERLDPEQLKFVISNTLQVFTNQIKKYNGVVEKFIGDAIMAIFGRAETNEDDSLRALTAGKAILDSIEDINSILSEKGISISARIGINRGLVVTGKLDGYETVTGEAINIAQRLEANAPENGILVNDNVYDECKNHYHYEKLPPLHVKNKEEPLTVYQVGDEIPQDKRQAKESSGPFVGREGEMATLKNAWDMALKGQMNLVQIIGPAGVGKRALIHNLFKSLKERNIVSRPIIVSTDSFGQQPYHALSDLVSDSMKGDETHLSQLYQTTKGTEESLENYEIYLKDLQGQTLDDTQKQTLEKMDPHARQIETILAVKKFLLAASQKSMQDPAVPMTVVFDNVEWFTQASKDALAQIIKTLPMNLGILWIFLARDRESTEWIPDRSSSSILSLGSLTLEATRNFLKQKLATDDLPEDIITQVYECTGGNPFFLDGVSSTLADIQDFSKFTLEENIPSTIKALVLTRFDRLPRPLKFALQVASIAGREFTGELFSHVIDRVGYNFDAIQVTSQLLDEQLAIKTEQGISITQPMMREVAYSTILYANRHKLHTLVASWIEEKQQDQIENYAPYLAQQWERAEDYQKAINYYTKAGQAARRRYAYGDASRLFEKALQINQRSKNLISTEDLSQLYLLLVELCEARGDPDKLKVYLKEGLQICEPDSLFYFKLRLREIVSENRYGDRYESPNMLEEFLNNPTVQQNSDLYLRALLTRSSFAQERGEDDTPYIEKSLEIQNEIKSPDLRYLLDNHVFNHYKNTDQLKKAESYFNRVLDVDTQNAYSHHMGDLLYCSYMWDRGDQFSTIDERAYRAELYFKDVGWARGIGWGAFYRGAALWRMGRFSEAHTEITKALQEMEKARDSYMIERLELLLSALCLFRGDTVGYHLRKRRILDRAKALSEREILTFKREFAMLEAQVTQGQHELTKVYQDLKTSASAPLAKVQEDELTVSTALVSVKLNFIQEGLDLINKIRDHVLENNKIWIAGLLYRAEAIAYAKQNDAENMTKAYQESITHLQNVDTVFDLYLTYKSWNESNKQQGLDATETEKQTQKLYQELKQKGLQ